MVEGAPNESQGKQPLPAGATPAVAATPAAGATSAAPATPAAGAGLAPTVDGPVPASPLEAPPAEVRAVSIGPYEIKGLLGEGGFGAVYLGEQLEPVRRLVAIKVIRPGREGKRFAERFASERRILASMDHPNIARVVDAGETKDGQPWIAMEYAPGLPISKYCDQNRLSVKDRIDLLETVAQAVQFAHEKGIVHRDLKPGNVLVSVDGGIAVPKIIDFGIAKVLGGEETGGDTGQVLGTPGFMAPEQTVSAGFDADPRADVYSLGAMLYLLLAGALPFDPSADAAATALRIRALDAPLMSDRLRAMAAPEQEEIARNRRTRPGALARALRGDLDMIAARCLDRDRMRRYANAGELVADLRRWRTLRPVDAAPDTLRYRTRKFVARHRSSVVLAALLALSVIGGGVVAAVGWYEASARLAKAQDAERRFANEAMESRAAVAFIGSVLQSANLDESPQGSHTTALEMLQRAERHADDVLRNRPATEAAVRLALGRVYASLGRLDDAQRNLFRGVNLVQKLHGHDSSELAEMYQALGDVSRLRKNYPAARELLKQAYEILQGMPEHMQVELAANRMAYADVQIDAGQAADALMQLEVAEHWARECDPPDEASLSSVQWFRATANLALGRYEAALQAADANLAYNRLHLATGHWWIAESETVRAAALAGLGRVQEAETLMHEALPRMEAALAEGAPPLRRAFARAAFVAEKAGHADAAAALRERAHNRPVEPPPTEKPPKGTPGIQAPS